MKGGTQQAVRRKTAGHKIGDKVKCISAGSNWHKVGRISIVVEHPTTGLPSILALDNEHDELCMAVSKFEATT